MRRGRPSWPARLRRPRVRFCAWLSSLPVRVGIVLVLAVVAPVLLVIALRGSDRTITIAVLFGWIIAVVGIELVVTRPLRAMQDAVDGWRRGGPFDLPQRPMLPLELRSLGRSFQRATLTLAARETQLASAVAQQELAMQEIHHRVKNNLQIVASLLNLQASRIRAPAAKAEFQAARDRVRALATVHRHLYGDGGLHTINMRAFLLELCGQLFQAMGETPGERIALAIEAPGLEMSSDQAVPLSLIVTEAVTNSIRYAFPDGRRGRVGVRLVQTGDQVVLEIEDNGIGLQLVSGNSDLGPRSGLGLQLIDGFARQLGGTLAVEQGEGTRYRIGVDLQRARPAGVPGPG